MSDINKATIHASDVTYPPIMRYAQNTELDWWHPLTRNQHLNFVNSNVGDIIPFKMNGIHASNVKIINLGNNNEYIHLKNVYGVLTIPTWNFDYFVRVQRV